MDFIGQLNRFLEPLRNRMRMVIGRAIVSVVNDNTKIQLMQITLMKDQVKDGVERVQNYGFTGHPLPDAEAVAVFPNGNRDYGMIVAVDDSRYRIKDLPEGGVAVYDYDGNYVKLTEANGIEIDAPNQKVTVKASGDIEIGNADLKKLVNDTFKDLFNNHAHNYVTGTLVAGPYPVTAVPAPPPPAPAPTMTTSPTTTLEDSHLTSKVKAE